VCGRADFLFPRESSGVQKFGSSEVELTAEKYMIAAVEGSIVPALINCGSQCCASRESRPAGVVG
jgi:hypothetical protein